jgi:hypothetical protein
VSMSVAVCQWGEFMGAGTRGILGGAGAESRGSGLFYLRGGRLVKDRAAGVERVMEEGNQEVALEFHLTSRYTGLGCGGMAPAREAGQAPRRLAAPVSGTVRRLSGARAVEVVKIRRFR